MCERLGEEKGPAEQRCHLVTSPLDSGASAAYLWRPSGTPGTGQVPQDRTTILEADKIEREAMLVGIVFFPGFPSP